jgi:hypothetical protein
MTKHTYMGRILAALMPLALFFSACNDTPDLTADYKDISIAYGILNINDPIHYFKVYKGFLTDENTLVQASQWENIYYPIDSIEVRLEEYNDHGIRQRSAVLDTTTAINKESGYFANPRQLLYYSDWTLNPDCRYRLVIKHKNSGKEVYAETNVVDNCKFTRPLSQNPFSSDSPTDVAPTFLVEGGGGLSTRDRNVAISDFYITFHYIEVDNNTQQVAHKTIKKKMNSGFMMPQSNGNITFDKFKPSDLLSMIAQGMSPNNNLTRYVDTVDGRPYFCLEVEAWLANTEFYNYYNISNPHGDIVQQRMEYTNFVSDDGDAYGLIASRNRSRIILKFDNTTGHNEDSLVNGHFTKNLNFDYYRNSPEFFEVTR